MSEREKLKAEVARSVAKMRRLTRELKRNKKKSLEFLVAAGILKPDGKFTERYKSCEDAK